MFLNFRKFPQSCPILGNRNRISRIVVILLFIYSNSCAMIAPLDLEEDGGLDSPDGTAVFSDSETETTQGTAEETDRDTGAPDASVLDSETEQESDSDIDTGTSIATDTSVATDTSIATDTETSPDPDTDTDQCPDDENKTEAGLCGCGVPEGTCVISCAGGNGRLDPKSKLCWQDPKAEATLTFGDALNYCNGLSLGGITDWRLPRLVDFMNLLGDCETDLVANKDGYCNTCENSSRCNEMFPLDTQNYWSRPAVSQSTAWLVRLGTGWLSPVDKLKERSVRCVWP